MGTLLELLRLLDTPAPALLPAKVSAQERAFFNMLYLSNLFAMSSNSESTNLLTSV